MVGVSGVTGGTAAGRGRRVRGGPSGFSLGSASAGETTATQGAAPAANLRFEPGRLSIAAADWTPQQVEQFRQQLRAAGWAVEAAGGVLTISRAPAPGGRA